jgi:putative transposase
MPNATYHVTARANRQEMVLHCHAMKDLFLATIKRAKKKYRFQVHTFCVMGNHIHLIIHPDQGESLSRIMQWILSVFAMAWNRKHHTNGHLWGERFFSNIINNNKRDYVKTFLYVTENPVKAQIAGRVDQWEYGGLWHFKIGNRDILGELPGFVAYLYHRIIASL